VWPVEQFQKYGVRYEQSAAPKSDLYRDLLPLLNSRRISLLDHPKLINQLHSLERQVRRGGRDSIDHPPNQHDDIANCVAGLAALASARVDLLHKYRAFQPDFVDEDLPAPRREPEPERGVVFAGSDWWRGASSSTCSSTADDRMRGYYSSLDRAIKAGLIR
jgi:hypothetical protein